MQLQVGELKQLAENNVNILRRQMRGCLAKVYSRLYFQTFLVFGKRQVHAQGEGHNEQTPISAPKTALLSAGNAKSVHICTLVNALITCVLWSFANIFIM